MLTQEGSKKNYISFSTQDLWLASQIFDSALCRCGLLMPDMYFSAHLIALLQNLLTINSEHYKTEMELELGKGI